MAKIGVPFNNWYPDGSIKTFCALNRDNGLEQIYWGLTEAENSDSNTDSEE